LGNTLRASDARRLPRRHQQHERLDDRGPAFQDANGKRLGSIRIGPVPREQWDKVFSNRGHSTALLERKGTKTVPKGTRTILVVLQTTKRDGADSDAIADNIRLTLGAAPAKG
jgi:hypothetical protein